MSLFGFGRSKIPFDMFDAAGRVGRSAGEARRAEKLAGIYHRGQDLAWDGREMLADCEQGEQQDGICRSMPVDVEEAMDGEEADRDKHGSPLAPVDVTRR